MSPGAPPPARPPDRLANPTLVVAIGRLGSEVATLLEDRAAELSEVLGEVTVRNLATLRILEQQTLKDVIEQGKMPTKAKPGDPPAERQRPLVNHRVVWFDPAWVLAEQEEAEKELTPEEKEKRQRGVRGPDYTDAFTERDQERQGHRQAFTGWDPKTTTGYPASDVLRQELREIIAKLFQVDSFVDYHYDRDAYPSRLDVYVVGDVTDALSEATHCAIQHAMAQLVAGPLAPLFREYYSNLAITHLLAFPIVDHNEVRAGFDGTRLSPMEAARRLVSRYRLEGQKISSEDGIGKGRMLSSRFLFMEDRSFRYVVTREQLQASLAEYITLMSVRRTGEPLVLRDLVQPLPAIDRNRYRERPLNHLVGAYSVATAEIPVHRIIRYCRNRQSLGLLNDYRDKPQDATYGAQNGDADSAPQRGADAPGELAGAPVAAATPASPETDAPRTRSRVEVVEEVREMFGELHTEGTNAQGGSIAREIAEWMTQIKREIQVQVDKKKGLYGIGDPVLHWELRDVQLWEYHEDIVEPFHEDMGSVFSESVPERFPFARLGGGGGGGPVYNERWLNKNFTKFHRLADFLVRKHLAKHFEDVESKAGTRTLEWLQEVRYKVDELLNARPSGWKDAREYLGVVLTEIRERVKTAQARVGQKEFDPVSTKMCYDKALAALGSLQDEVDKKPIAQRALRAGQVLGIAGGLILGAIVTVLPSPDLWKWSPGGVGWLVFPSVAGVLALAWWHLRRLAQIRCDAINDVVRPKRESGDRGGDLNQIFDEQTDLLFNVEKTDSKYFLGSRVEWSCRLWTLRVWRRMFLALEQDLLRLGDIGTVLDVQTTRVRDDQESLRVRFHEEDHRFLEEARGVFDGDSFFCKSLIPTEVLEDIYDYFSRPAARYAAEHLGSENPFAQWRDRTPFTDLDAVQDHCRGPFSELEDLDFFRFPVTSDGVQARLRDFLGDFTHKLALHADAGDGVAGEMGQSEQLILTSTRNASLVDELGPDELWSQSWEMDDRYPDAHAITLIRHVQGLAPWELPSLGSPVDLVRDMIKAGEHGQIAGVIHTIEDVSLRIVMAGVALAELCALPEAVMEAAKGAVRRAKAQVEGSAVKAGAENGDGGVEAAATLDAPPAPAGGSVQNVNQWKLVKVERAGRAGVRVVLEDGDSGEQRTFICQSDEDEGQRETIDMSDSVGFLHRELRVAFDGYPLSVEELSLCRELLGAAAVDNVHQAAQNPVDGQQFVSLSAGRGWIHALQGEEGALDLALLLFGTSVLEEHGELSNLIARKDLLMDAGEGQVDWALVGLMQMPSEWRHPVLMRLVEAEMVPYLLAQDKVEEALAYLDILQPESLRSSALLRAVGILVERGNEDHVRARGALELARIPLDDDFPPMPTTYDEWTGEDGYIRQGPEALVNRLVSTLGSSVALSIILVSVYGTPAYRDGGGWRVDRLIQAHPDGARGLLTLLSEYPPGLVDASLKAAVFKRAAKVPGRSGQTGGGAP